MHLGCTSATSVFLFPSTNPIGGSYTRVLGRQSGHDQRVGHTRVVSSCKQASGSYWTELKAMGSVYAEAAKQVGQELSVPTIN